MEPALSIAHSESSPQSVPPPRPLSLTRLDITLVTLLLVASALLHFCWLGRPSSVVFDEVYYGETTRGYLFTRKNDFNNHPPHAKLLIALVAKFAGYRGTGNYANIGNAIPLHDSYASRLASALAGTLLPLLFFMLARTLGGSSSIAWLAGFAALFDNAMLIQTRTVALDGILLASLLGSLVLSFRAFRANGFFSHLFWMIGAGVIASVCAGTKFTGLAVLPMIAWLGFFEMRRRRLPGLMVATGVLCFASVFVAVYVAGFWIHFQRLYLPGESDKFYHTSGRFFTDLWEYHKALFLTHRNLTSTHPSSSHWWQWPFDVKAVYYWVNGNRRLYFVGNAVVWVGSTVLFLLGVSIYLFEKMGLVGRRLVPVGRNIDRGLPLFAFVVSYLPFVSISRVMFLYHYLPSLSFAMLFGLLNLDYLGWTTSGHPLREKPRYYFLFLLVLGGFLLFAPITFALQVPPEYFTLLGRLWIPWN